MENKKKTSIGRILLIVLTIASGIVMVCGISFIGFYVLPSFGFGPTVFSYGLPAGTLTYGDYGDSFFKTLILLMVASGIIGVFLSGFVFPEEKNFALIGTGGMVATVVTMGFAVFGMYFVYWVKANTPGASIVSDNIFKCCDPTHNAVPGSGCPTMVGTCLAPYNNVSIATGDPRPEIKWLTLYGLLYIVLGIASALAIWFASPAQASFTDNLINEFIGAQPNQTKKKGREFRINNTNSGTKNNVFIQKQDKQGVW